jgi:hypothetical protein
MEYNKMETEKIHLTEQMSSLPTNKEKVKDTGTVANAFNHFFYHLPKD